MQRPALWLLLLGWVAWRGRVSARALTALAAGYLLLLLGRYAEAEQTLRAGGYR